VATCDGPALVARRSVFGFASWEVELASTDRIAGGSEPVRGF